jgi:hypothetical protein
VQPLTATIPKNARYSSSQVITLLFGLGILTFDERTGQVALPHATDRASFTDHGDRLVADFGRPRVARVSGVKWNDEKIEVKYHWKFDNAHGQRLAESQSNDTSGVATFANRGGVWVVTSATARYLNQRATDCP